MHSNDTQIQIFLHNLAWLRKKHNLSKADMAKKLKIGLYTLNKIEAGILPPRLGCRILEAVYYSFSVYDSFLKQLENLHKDKKVAFFISSNEEINRSYFEGSYCFFYESPSAVEDLYTLSLCDKIIGPYSTFSRWASFIGEKPLCFLESSNMIIGENNFLVIIDFFHFSNGKKILDW